VCRVDDGMCSKWRELWILERRKIFGTSHPSESNDSKEVFEVDVVLVVR